MTLYFLYQIAIPQLLLYVLHVAKDKVYHKVEESERIIVMCFVCYSYEVMKQCWNADKTDRPLFTTLHETLQDYSTSEDLTNLISLQNIDSQSSYYQPRRHQSVRGIGGERLERKQQGEDGLESREEGRQGEEGGEIVMADGASGKNFEIGNDFQALQVL